MLFHSVVSRDATTLFLDIQSMCYNQDVFAKLNIYTDYPMNNYFCVHNRNMCEHCLKHVSVQYVRESDVARFYPTQRTENQRTGVTWNRQTPFGGQLATLACSTEMSLIFYRFLFHFNAQLLHREEFVCISDRKVCMCICRSLRYVLYTNDLRCSWNVHEYATRSNHIASFELLCPSHELFYNTWILLECEDWG